MFELPTAAPVTVPVALTVATDVLLLLHVPPVIASTKVEVEATQIVEVPEIEPATGGAFTVIAFVVVAVPQVKETV